MFDLLIKGGHTARGERLDLGVTGSKIVAAEPRIEARAEKVLLLGEDDIVSAGWIDGHVHCFEDLTLYHDRPDEVGVRRGVTTVVDAGSAGADTMARFHELASAAVTNVYALVNIARTGIVAQDELFDLSRVDGDAVRRTLRDFPDFVVGIKARMSASVVGPNGAEPLRLAKQIQGACDGVPLMVHTGSNPPLLSETIALLGEGDILTHCYNGKPNGVLDPATGHVADFVWEGYRRGVRLDVGHGTESFSLPVARTAFAEGLVAQTVSTDLCSRNRLGGPVYDLATTMEKMLLVGYDLASVVDAVTVEPARALGLSGKGVLSAGSDADVTVFRVTEDPHVVVDSCGNEMRSPVRITATHAVIGGSVHACDR